MNQSNGQNQFTVIVPVFQDVNIFSLFASSLVKNITTPTEVIFINDGSGLAINNLIQEIKNKATALLSVIHLENQHPKGSAYCINRALRISTREFITIVDSDIIFQNPWQEKVLATFKSDAKIGAVGGLLLYPQTGGIQHAGIAFTEDSAKHLFLNGRPESVRGGIIRVQCVIFAFCVIRHSVVQKTGLLDEQYIHAYDDLDYQMRIQEAGFNIVVNPDICLFHWERSNGFNRALNRKNNLARFWRKWGSRIQADLWSYARERIETVLHASEKPIYVTGVDLCSIRSEARILWKNMKRVSHLICIDKIADYSHKVTSEIIWLPLILENDFFRNSGRLLFLVNNFCQLTDNNYWLTIRSHICADDLVMDLYGNFMTLQELNNYCWPGKKIR